MTDVDFDNLTLGELLDILASNLKEQDGITFVGPFVPPHALAVMQEIYAKIAGHSCTEEELSKAYGIATNEKYLAYISPLLLVPIAKHPNSPRYILLELALNESEFISDIAKKHPTLISYRPFE